MYKVIAETIILEALFLNKTDFMPILYWRPEVASGQSFSSRPLL